MKKCRTCKGKGRWAERIEHADGEIEVRQNYCNDCRGTGIEQDPEQGADYDIGGDSYADD